MNEGSLLDLYWRLHLFQKQPSSSFTSWKGCSVQNRYLLILAQIFSVNVQLNGFLKRWLLVHCVQIFCYGTFARTNPTGSVEVVALKF